MTTTVLDKAWARYALAGLALLSMLSFSLGNMTLVQDAQAHRDPGDCNASGYSQFPFVQPGGAVYDGDTLTYSVSYSNQDPDGAGPAEPCNITELDASITLPDGTAITVLTNATLSVGDSISCPADPECVDAGPYTYVVDHGDEENGTGAHVTAEFDSEGVLHRTTSEDVATEFDTLTSPVLHGSTAVTILSSEATVLDGGTVDLTVTEENDGDADLSNVSVSVNDGTSDIATLVSPPDSGDDGDGILEPGETWSWTVEDVTVNSNTTFTATGEGEDEAGNVVTWCEDTQNPGEGIRCDQDERDSVDVDVINPSTDVDASVDLDVVYSGDEVILTVTESNDGDVDLTNPHVELSPLGLTLDENSAEFVGGDAGDLGVLDPGETWTWEVADNPASDTTYVAIGHGTDSLGNDITWCEDTQNPDEGVVCDQDERAEVSVDIIAPSTIVTISTSATSTIAGGAVDLTVTEENDGDTDLTNVSVDVDNGVGTLSSPPDSGDDGDNILEPGETWTWNVNDVTVNTDTTFTATGHGEDALGNDVTWCEDTQNPPADVLCDQDERDNVRVTTANPSTITAITSVEAEVLVGGDVELTITEQNDGDTDLTNAHVVVDNGVGTLSSPPDNGDDGDGILEPGETWSWTEIVTISTTTTFIAIGHGTDPFGNDVTWCEDPQNPDEGVLCDQDERDSVTVTALRLGSISGMKWNDEDGSGTINGEEDGLAGWTIFIDEDEDGELDGGEESTVTDADGNYSFEDLEPGTYVVCEVQQEGWDQTFPGGDGCHSIELSVAEDSEDNDFGNQERLFAGCTPGYWRQSQHFGNWNGYTMGQSFESVFGVDVTLRGKGKATIDDPTLLEAVTANGGGINALARHATAALLNAANLGDQYPYTEAEVIQMVQDALDGGDIEGTKNLFADANENSDLGCPLGRAELGDTEEVTLSQESEQVESQEQENGEPVLLEEASSTEEVVEQEDELEQEEGGGGNSANAPGQQKDKGPKK